MIYIDKYLRILIVNTPRPKLRKNLFNMEWIKANFDV